MNAGKKILVYFIGVVVLLLAGYIAGAGARQPTIDRVLIERDMAARERSIAIQERDAIAKERERQLGRIGESLAGALERSKRASDRAERIEILARGINDTIQGIAKNQRGGGGGQ
jgi:hypothetical protein